MAFTFECPHCAQSFEAEVELCGSTCNCSNCGGLFLVPEVDLSTLERLDSASFANTEALEMALDATRVQAKKVEEALQEEVKRLNAKNVALENSLTAERSRLEARVGALEGEREAAQKRLEQAETAAKGPAAEAMKLRGELERMSAEKAALEQANAQERSRLEARVGALEEEREAVQKRLEQAETAAKGPAAEAMKLRGELERMSAEKAALEQANAQERSRLEARTAGFASERTANALRADQAEAAVNGLVAEVERLTHERAALDRRVAEERNHLEARLREAEKGREAALLRVENSERQLLELQSKVESLSKKKSSTASPSRERGAEKELREILAQRDLALETLSAQLSSAEERAASLAATSISSTSAALSPSTSSKRPIPLWTALATGVVLGVGLAKIASHSNTAEPSVPPVAHSSVAQASESKLSEETQPASRSGSDASVGNPPSASVSTSATPSGGFSAGMPSRLPEGFLGIKFGTDLVELTGRGQWQETAGKRHRKAELLGASVEAVLTPDDAGRLVMGSYVRMAARQPESLTPFLEWAVNAQDAVSALYGEPSRLHRVEGSAEASEVVRRIASGADFYEATWEREGEDTMMDLSIRVFNERTVVFRLEYRSRELVTAFQERQANAEKASAEQSPTEKPSEKVSEEKTPVSPSSAP